MGGVRIGLGTANALHCLNGPQPTTVTIQNLYHGLSVFEVLHLYSCSYPYKSPIKYSCIGDKGLRRRVNGFPMVGVEIKSKAATS